MELNEPVLVHWIDADVLLRIVVAAVVRFLTRPLLNTIRPAPTIPIKAPVASKMRRTSEPLPPTWL